MKTVTWRIAVLSVMALALGGYLAGCGSSVGVPGRMTTLRVYGHNDNAPGGLNVHLWAVEGAAQAASAQVAAQGVADTPHILPGGERQLLYKGYSAWATGTFNLPSYIRVYAGRGNNPSLGSRRVDLPQQSYNTDTREAVPVGVKVDVGYADGATGPVWNVVVESVN